MGNMGFVHPLVEVNVSFKFEENPSISKGVIERKRIGDGPTDRPTDATKRIQYSLPTTICGGGIISNCRLFFNTVLDSSQFLVLCLVHSSPNVTSKLQSKLTLVPSFCLEKAGVQLSLCRSDVMEGLADWLIAKKTARLSKKKTLCGHSSGCSCKQKCVRARTPF